MEQPFRFKQFTIHQGRCAMKVGTDGVLLGAWAPLAHRPNAILDIGAGTGLIALMLAQRSTAEVVDAVESDPDAYEQCVGNFEGSPWPDRLFCYHADFDAFVDEMDDMAYDLIVSNPPFHTETVASADAVRDQARRAPSLPLDSLFRGVSQLLSDSGVFATIVPYAREMECLEMADCFGLGPTQILRVKGNEGAPVKRSLMAFGRGTSMAGTETLVIEAGRHRYTPDYIGLTRDFYLNM